MAKSSYHVLWWLCCMTVLLLGQLREVSGQCLKHQKSLLIKLNHSLITQNDGTDDLNPRRLARWNFSRDCCGWPGVTCSRNGYVTGLDLSYEGIQYGLNNSSPLFDLQYLTSLNLAGSRFQWRPDMPTGFERLVNMMHLNMSWSTFTGRFPIEISNMTRLVSLYLSFNFHVGLSEAQFNLSMLVGNMSKLTELRLDHIYYLGMQEESDRSQVLSSSLPHLQVLSLKYCQLSGSIPDSLTKLTSLTYLDLSDNPDIGGSIPVSFGGMKMLSILKVRYCNLHGSIPSSLSKLTSLTYLDLSHNSNMSGSIPSSLGELKMLSVLKLHHCNLQGFIPNSLAKLTTLNYMDLSYNHLSGTIPNSFAKRTTLTYMDLSYNQLSGTIPSLSQSKNLTYLDLGANQLIGSILGTQWSDMSQLEHISFYDNSLSGSIPISLFGIPTLKKLYFYENSFVNFTNEPVNTSSSLLEVLDLSGNELQGLFPSFILGLKALRWLDIGSNNFSGIFYFDSMRQLRNLSTLILSYNNFSIDFGQDLLNFSDSFRLGLASYKLKAFPKFLQNDIKYKMLDLSANEIRGEIPVWIWSKLEFEGSLNLSYNQLETFESPVGHFYHCEASLIDLSSNRLHGNIPKFSAAFILDLSNNMFDSTIFSSINMSTIWLLLASNNRLEGSISESLCNATSLKVIDLSNNFLSGILPSCLTKMTSLSYLNLKNNRINGTIPDSFPLGCSLKVVYLSNNSLLGSIPKSLGNCTNLEILDLGNNKLHEDFPCRASNISESLWSGTLELLDLSNNLLSGIFPSCLPQMPRLKYLSLKNNNIRGTIPDTFPRDCNLKTLILNGNSLLGNIPKSLGKCTGLEVLDMGNNELHDNFPCWMSNISTLEVLVLKSNMLEGSIICPDVNVSWPSLQILDIASNNFNGSLPSKQLVGWNSMILRHDSNLLDNDVPHYIKCRIPNYYDYEVVITLTWKGIEATIQKISASLVFIDLSDNALEGSIPTEFGYFTALYSLNLSNNGLRGQIPSSLGNIKNLESLDLQKNQLTGVIPVQLANLNFLSVLNLSFNQLEGMIPKGVQLQTLSSFMHNKGLCGFPLNKTCAEKDGSMTLPKPATLHKPAEKFTRDVLISAEVGYAVGLGMIIMPLIFWPKWRMRFFQFIDRILPHSWRS